MLPGNTVDLSAKAEVKGTIPMYIFAELNIPSSFTMGNFNSGWHKLSEESNIYYYGSADSLVAVGPGNPSVSIFDTITLDKDAGNGQAYTVTITGYAIQANNIAADTNPSIVFGMIEKPSTTATEPTEP